MSEQEEHSKLWADKLQDISLPEPEMAWQDMNEMLDEQMPPAKKDKRRWVLLILLLLLLIGVCNCPAGKRLGLGDHNSSAGYADSSMAKNIDKKTDSDSAGNSVNNDKKSIAKSAEIRKHIRGSLSYSVLNNDSNKLFGKGEKDDDVDSGKREDKTERAGQNNSDKKADAQFLVSTQSPVKKRKVSLKESAHSNVVSKRGEGFSSAYEKASVKKGTGSSNKKTNDRSKKGNGTSSVDVGDDNKNKDMPVVEKSVRLEEQTGSIKTDSATQTSTRTADTMSAEKKLLPAKDSTAKDITAEKQKKSKKKDHNSKQAGWAFAAGINHFFAIGQQKSGSSNGDGVSGKWRDYLPVPQVRYHFGSKLYLQLEAQFNAPQYTSNLLIQDDRNFDSSGTNISVESKVSVKKLFYLNAPLSVHFSPVKNLYVGAGLQFSHLSNGVAEFAEQAYRQGVPDTLGSSIKTRSFKQDSVYSLLSANEWRYLLDISYRWKALTIGARYNQAFNNVVDVQLSTGQSVKARNQSLQIYLRYTLWRSRRLKLAGIY